jgi:hypothetical protein
MHKPGKFVFHGPAGLGKSTLAAQFPNPVFIDTEEGTQQMNVSRLDRPTSVPHFIGMINSLTKDHQGFKSLIIDTLDWLQDLYISSALAQTGLKVMGWTKDDNAYTLLYQEWNQMLDALSELRNSGMIIVLVAHSEVKKREVPEEFGAYDRYQLKLLKGAAAKTCEWAEYLWFINMRIEVVKSGDGKHAPMKATGGERVIYTGQHPCWDAKSRPTVPPVPAEIVFRDGKMPDVMRDLIKQQLAGAQAPAPAAPAPTQKPVMHVSAGKEPSKALYQLLDLMEQDAVTGDQLIAEISSKGYFPADTPVDGLGDDFLTEKLIPNWKNVVKKIKGEPANV